MKARELRIGNCIYDEYNEVTIVDGIKNDEILTSGVWLYSKEFKPIPLTEKWFRAFGFRQYKGYEDSFQKGEIAVYLGIGDTYIGQSRKNGHWTLIDQKIAYVHQLQNLYFALTGKELTK